MAAPEAKKYVKDFEEMGFGLFVHWGLYSQLESGEWTWRLNKIDDDTYLKLFDTFKAEEFDAEALVLAAKNAGCKYITLTTRHHEGFSLYDTCGLNEFDAPHSPAKRDLVKEFTEACRKYGIVPFFYHTTLDWFDKDYKFKQKNCEDTFDNYLEYLRKSVEILCKNYGKIGGFWFDGNWDRPHADWKEGELYATIRKYQPEAIIVNNTGLSHRGETGNIEIDSVTFEQGLPTPMNREGMPKYLAAEMCYTMNDHWGIAANDFNFKSPKELIESLCDCRKVGANFLLNIAPTGSGRIDPMQGEMLKIIGKWMKIYGEAIYKGKPCNVSGMGKNFALENDNYMYFFFYDLARTGHENVTVGGNYCGSYVFGNVTSDLSELQWMDTGERLEFVQNGDLLAVNATGYPYGTSTCVRVANAFKEK